jgi:hypothetical protein
MHPDGDRSDWFALSSELARDVAESTPTVHFVSSSPSVIPALYSKQRLLFDRLDAGSCDPLEAEEEVLG